MIGGEQAMHLPFGIEIAPGHEAPCLGRGRQNAIVREIQRGGLPSGTMRDGK